VRVLPRTGFGTGLSTGFAGEVHGQRGVQGVGPNPTTDRRRVRGYPPAAGPQRCSMPGSMRGKNRRQNAK
jgi:hypothetical protein